MLSFYAFEEFRMKATVIVKQLFTELSLVLSVFRVSPKLVSITSFEVRKQSQADKAKVAEQESKSAEFESKLLLYFLILRLFNLKTSLSTS